MKSILNLTPSAFQAFVTALPAIKDGKIQIVPVAGKSGKIHTVWIVRPYGSKYSDLLSAVEAEVGASIEKAGKRLLSALWADMDSILPPGMGGGSFRVTLGKDQKPGIGFNAKSDAKPVIEEPV
jgi:hypothetical protein